MAHQRHRSVLDFKVVQSSNRREFAQAGQKERGARQPHKRPLYCVNVNRTSLAHLLLGKNADIDQMSNAPSIPRDRGDVSKRILASSAALRNFQRPPSRSHTFRILAAAGKFPTLASSSARDYKASGIRLS